MSKTTIAIFYFIGIFVGIIATILFFGFLIDYNSSAADLQSFRDDCNSLPPSYSEYRANCDSNLQIVARDLDSVQIGMIITGPIMVIADILYVIAWIGTLANLSRGKQWGWFVLIFFFGLISISIYFVEGPAIPKAGKA
jgi:hypothetical protein